MICSGFTFSIWSIIYLWLAASLVFFIASIFITNPAGRSIVVSIVVDIVIVIIVTIVILSSFCHSSHFAKRSPTYSHRAYLSPPVATPAVMATFSANMVRCAAMFDVSGKNTDRQLSETFGE